jgi:Flp pilus assembly protein TadG
MVKARKARAQQVAGILTRLRRDVRGNVLALTAAILVPLIAIVGGSVDVGRMYLTRVRLQHACDAGALAGRKAMGAGTWAQTNPSPSAAANSFFNGNFASGAYGTTGLTYAYSENSGDVTGTASTVVPMTIMRFFGMPSRTISVTCDAQMQIPNTDVMFVLDNTGSMACDPNGNNCYSGSTSKIMVLKNAVKCFYEAVAQYKTNGTCTNSISGTGVNSSSQIRFGFMPYTTNVNVGYSLPTSYFANSWPYQSREVSSVTWGNWQSSGASCNNIPANTLTTQYQAVTNNRGNCTSVQTRTGTVVWHYGQITQNISALKNGTSWNTSFTLPIGSNGASQTLTWDGCIEERQTVRTSGTLNFTPIPAGAKDLDIDTPPNPSDSTTLWAPALDDIIFTRNGTNSGNWTTSDQTTSSNYGNGSSYFCPTAAKKLQTWSDPAPFDTYVDSLQASGNTYHDIGMLWGGRFMSPTGIFSSENATTSQGGTIQRHMIFMTDGDTQTDPGDYAAYGVPWFDRRETPSGTVPTGGAGSTGTLTQQVNARFASLCTAVKNKGIIVWVISFGGTGIASDTKARLQTCATDSNHYFDATSSASLNSAFQLIAAQITQLRLTK